MCIYIGLTRAARQPIVVTGTITEPSRRFNNGSRNRLLGLRLWAPATVEYAERGKEYSILFILSLLYEYTPLEYVRIPVIFRVHQTEYVIHILVAASQEYVSTYSTRRVRLRLLFACARVRLALYMTVTLRGEYAERRKKIRYYIPI